MLNSIVILLKFSLTSLSLTLIGTVMEVLPVSLLAKCLETVKSKSNQSNTKISFAKKSLITAVLSIIGLLKF